MEEITKELLDTILWIPYRERQGKWYEEYLQKVFEDLKDKNKKQNPKQNHNENR